MSATLNEIIQALKSAEPRPPASASAPDKKNYAERLSKHLATCIANRLRPKFPGILPDEDGGKQESLARTAKGFKKLDINYSTPQLGLALGVSIKTLNFPDASSARFTKNYSRIDSELRAEATDYHQRQPYAVLVGVLFLPIESCDDARVGKGAEAGTSSFGSAVKFFRTRANRSAVDGAPDLFERFFIGLYDLKVGETLFFDVMQAPPRNRRPREDESIDFAGLIAAITETYDARNNPPFFWAE
jgi:hypothetical protein